MPVNFLPQNEGFFRMTINFPDKMARLAKCKIAGVSDDRPSASPDLEASQISDG
jgi:hypothetical protein